MSLAETFNSDICWIKTNKTLPKYNKNIESGAIFQRTKV